MNFISKYFLRLAFLLLKNSRYKHRISPEFVSAIFRFHRHALTAPETVFLGALVVNRYRLCLDRDLRRTPLLSPAAESTSCVLFRNVSHSGEYIGV